MNDETLLIGTVARACGVSADTIRHYERVGVIARAARDTSGYRRYPATVVERVRIVRRALAVGFTLEELSVIFRERAAGNAPCRRVRSMAAEKLQDLDAKLAELLDLRRSLSSLIETWDQKLAQTTESAPAYLLETMTTGDEP